MTYHHATHPDLQCILDIIHDTLEEAEIRHVIEVTDENPDCYSCAAHDETNHFNFGFVSRNPEGKIIFAAHKPDVENHDVAEGISEDASLSWWFPSDTEMFLDFLDGTVRDILARGRAESYAQNLAESA